MTLITLFEDNDGILLCGDGLRQEQNNPIPRTDVSKVFCTNDQRICFALYGAVPFPDGHGGYWTDLWLADFAAQPSLVGASVRDTAIRMQGALSSPTLNNLGASGGGFLVAGYEGSNACVFEIYCHSKSDVDKSLIVAMQEVQSSNFRQNPLLRGVYDDYSILHRDLGLAFPISKKEQIEWFNVVVKELFNKGMPVGGQPKHITIERPKVVLQYINSAESEIQGSFYRGSPSL